jgi:uncharacterized protein (TIGR02145 family)
MKKQLFILAVLSIALFSCKSNNDVETLVTVKLNPSFISLNEGSNEAMKVKGNGLIQMNSATTTDSVVYAIQVYENDVPSYYGLFNDVSKMQLALTTSKTYKFKVSAYKAGTGKGLKAVLDTAGTNYFLPNKTPLKNKFIKGDALKDIDLASSIGMNTTTKAYPEVDAFYSTKTLTLDKGTTSIDFTLLRMGFGINFMVDALTAGSMEIYLGNDTLKLNSTKTSAYTIRQFATSTNTFTNIYTNATTFGDSIAITAKWTSASGTIVTAAGKYKFLRNYQKTMTIQLNTTGFNMGFEDWNTVTDVDGNVYKTVTIGTQTWMAENLKVTHYRDGTAIPSFTTSSAWASLTTGARYDNKSNFGHLYNWYAVSDNRNIAPIGWHVATDAEWTTLSTYLGGDALAGGKLKEAGITHWLTPNTGATNESGFSSLPGGGIGYNGVDQYGNGTGDTAIYWSKDSYSTSSTWIREMYNNSTTLDRLIRIKQSGFSVRCVKD